MILMRVKHHRPGFGILQLLVLIGVLLFFAAMAVPAIQKLREAASRSQSMNNMRQVVLAMHNFHDANNEFPPAVGSFGTQTGPTHFHLLPYLEQQPLFQAADGASWKNGTYGTVLQVFIDPRDPSLPDHLYKDWLATTNYAVNWMVTREGKMQIANITDGTSNTLMFSERYQMCNGAPTAWGYPSIHTWAPMFAYYSAGRFQSAPSQDKCDPHLPQSLGRDIMVGMCDGSTRMISADIRPTSWHYLCDPSDGNVIPQEDFD
jgi:type II secretory pathway pseudopilin PulG